MPIGETALVRLTAIGLTFPDKTLFQDLSWHIRPGQRIGLVGDNGVGKTTLIRIISGHVAPDLGRVEVTRSVRVGHLEQEIGDSADKPLIEVVVQAVGDLKEIEREMEELRGALATLDPESKESAEAMLRLGHLQEHFDHIDGFRLESKARRILSGLGFDEPQMDQPLSAFSGGWQRRGAMARLLLSAPDLLLLDEPTNHLDTDAVEWLERYLRNYKGTVLIVSHDRFFLERTVTQISELERGALHHFVGSYSDYRRLKEADRERRQAEYETQKVKIQEMQRFIERFRYKASKAKQVQSRVRMLEKMDILEPVEDETAAISFSFPRCERAGDVVLELDHISKRYGDNQVFSDLSLRLERGERVALVGANGAGKSTLSRILSGLEEPTSGTRTLGHKVILGSYTQEVVDQLDTSRSVLDELASIGESANESTLRSLLGCFLFRGDSVFKPVEVLSGGEKSRLAVAKLLLQRANFLVLDEPTNHLDIKAKRVLQQALAEFEGTVLVVSHDRYFLDKVVGRVLRLKDGRLENYLGNYSFYLGRIEGEGAEDESKNGAAKAASKDSMSKSEASSKPRTKEERKKATQEKIRRGRILREKQAKVDEIEATIAPLETRLEELESEMAREEVFSDPEKLRELSVEHGKLRKEIDDLYSEWETAQTEIEETREALERESEDC